MFIQDFEVFDIAPHDGDSTSQTIAAAELDEDILNNVSETASVVSSSMVSNTSSSGTGWATPCAGLIRRLSDYFPPQLEETERHEIWVQVTHSLRGDFGRGKHKNKERFGGYVLTKHFQRCCHLPVTFKEVSSLFNFKLLH